MAATIRKKLGQLGAVQRHKFSGRFIKYGFKYNDFQKKYASPTILLGNIELITGDETLDLTDHLWFNLTKGFKKLGVLHDNEVISFYGRVSNYTKGYVGLKQNVNKPLQDDYKISFPSKVKLELDLTAETIAIHKNWPEKDSQICNMIYEMYSVDYESCEIIKLYPKFYY